MAKAIDEDRKTQTRRIIKPQPAYVCGHDNEEVWHPNEKKLIKCPYGKIGDIIPLYEALKTRKNKKGKGGYDYKLPFAYGEIVEERVERVQDISEEDLRKEGIDTGEKPWIENGIDMALRPSFKILWNSIYGKDAW